MSDLQNDLQNAWQHLIAIIQTPVDDPTPSWEEVNGDAPIPIEYLLGQTAIIDPPEDE